jgi:drug/metabolite transporter (DMT)-like permease
MRPRAEMPAVSPFFVLFLSVLAVGWAAPLIRLTAAPPLAISFWRLVLSLPIIALILTARGEWAAILRLQRREWVIAVAAGILLAGHFASWIAAVTLTSVAASVALVATQPVWVALIALVVLKERPLPRHWFGIGAAVVGAAVIGWGDWAAGPDPIRGDLLALLGALLVAGYYVIGRSLRQGIGIWPYVAVVYTAAALTLLVAMPLAAVPIMGPYEQRDWMVFGALATGPMLIGHTGQNWALRYLPAYAVNLTLLGEPVVATLIAWLMPGIAERPPLSAVAGGMLILIGILVGLRRR